MNSALGAEWHRLRSAFSQSRPPLITAGICFVLIALFAIEQFFPIKPAVGLVPNVETNAAMGALDISSVTRGQWWRLFTSPLLHGGPAHLITDGVALMGVGTMLEPLIGRAWFGAVCALGALAGGLASLLFLSHDSIPIGSTGAVMSVLGANFVCGFHCEDHKQRAAMWKVSAYYLVPALYRTFTPQGYLVDVSAHVGGTIAGFLLGGFLILIWPKGARYPGFNWLGSAIGCAFVCASTVGFANVTTQYKSYVRKHAELIPDRDYPITTKQGVARSDEYVSRYPKDPRAHDFRGLFYLTNGDLSDGEDEFRVALKLSPESLLSSDVADYTRGLLAYALWQEGRVADAKAAIGKSCHARDDNPQFQQVLKMLRDGNICLPGAG